MINKAKLPNNLTFEKVRKGSNSVMIPELTTDSCGLKIKGREIQTRQEARGNKKIKKTVETTRLN